MSLDKWAGVCQPERQERDIPGQDSSMFKKDKEWVWRDVNI